MLVFLAGAALGAFFIVRGIQGTRGQLTRVVMPGTADLTLSQTGKYTIYYEYRSVVGETEYRAPEQVPTLRVRITSKATGQQVATSPASVSTTYALASQAGESWLDFTVDTPGTYVLSAAYPSGAVDPRFVLAVGNGIVGRLVGNILLGIGMLMAGFALAVATVIAVLVMRERSSHALRFGV